MQSAADSSWGLRAALSVLLLILLQSCGSSSDPDALSTEETSAPVSVAVTSLAPTWVADLTEPTETVLGVAPASSGGLWVLVAGDGFTTVQRVGLDGRPQTSATQLGPELSNIAVPVMTDTTDGHLIVGGKDLLASISAEGQLEDIVHLPEVELVDDFRTKNPQEVVDHPWVVAVAASADLVLAAVSGSSDIVQWLPNSGSPPTALAVGAGESIAGLASDGSPGPGVEAEIALWYDEYDEAPSAGIDLLDVRSNSSGGPTVTVRRIDVGTEHDSIVSLGWLGDTLVNVTSRLFEIPADGGTQVDLGIGEGVLPFPRPSSQGGRLVVATRNGMIVIDGASARMYDMSVDCVPGGGPEEHSFGEGEDDVVADTPETSCVSTPAFVAMTVEGTAAAVGTAGDLYVAK
jgi:hypothetical protein